VGTGAAPDQIEEAIEVMEPETSLRDDMLRLIFTCCHPALSGWPRKFFGG
jgi:predicted RNA polymerase sigma factor